MWSCICLTKLIRMRPLPAKLTMFAALHALHARGLDTSLSVSPPVKRVICDKTKERSVQIFIPHESESFSLVFREEEWLVDATPSTWNIGSGSPRWSDIADFQSIFARSTSAVAHSKEVQLTLIGSRLYALSNEPKMNIRPIRCPKPPNGAQKRKTAVFRVKSHFPWRK